MLFSFTVLSQNEISDDPETIQNSIDYKVSQAQQDIENSNYFEAQKKLEDALVLAEQISDKKSIGISKCGN